MTINDLRNRSANVPDRVVRGKHLVVTRDGAEVAELRPRPRPAASAADLVARRRSLPAVDPEALRADIDGVVDPSM